MGGLYVTGLFLMKSPCRVGGYSFGVVTYWDFGLKAPTLVTAEGGFNTGGGVSGGGEFWKF